MRFRIFLLFICVLQLNFATAQLTVRGNTTQLTVTDDGTLKANQVVVTDQGIFNLRGDNSRLSAGTLTVRDNASLIVNGVDNQISLTNGFIVLTDGTVLLNGDGALIRVASLDLSAGGILRTTGPGSFIAIDDNLRIASNGQLIADVAPAIIEADRIRVEDEGLLRMGNTTSELFSYSELIVDDGGEFVANCYVEATDIDSEGLVTFEIGDDESAGEYGTVLVQGVANVGGTLRSVLINGYVPAGNQRYRLIELDDQFSQANFTGELPGPGWSYDIEQNYVDLVYDAAVLPVEWLSFTGLWERKAVRLNWQTATESDTRHFIVERLDPATGWKSIGTVAAAGTSTNRQDYTFLDLDPGPADPLFYRLQQVDLDGSFSYSSIIDLRQSDHSAEIMVSPNPAREQCVVDNLAVGPYQLIDGSGRVILRGRHSVAGRLTLLFPADLPLGSYLLMGADGRTAKISIVK